MRDPNNCIYCDNKMEVTNEEIIDTRTDYSRKGDFYPGMEVWIEENILKIVAVGDTYEPSYIEDEIKINYCPMCGRSLKDERSK